MMLGSFFDLNYMNFQGPPSAHRNICTLFLLCRFIYCSFAVFREALSFAASFAAFRQLLCHTLCAQKQIDKNTWFYKDNDNDNNNTRTNT